MGCATSAIAVEPIDLAAAQAMRDEVVEFRERFHDKVRSCLTTRRPDVVVDLITTPWKPGNSYDVGDLFHSTFKKSSKEINIAFKGG